MEIAVVILNYNGKNFLEKFLPSVVKHSGDARIYVADNCSTDDSVEFVKNNYPSIALIQNESNGGFAKGYNDALAHVNEDIYILLNSDIEVTENWIMPCVNLMMRDDNIVAVQPKVLSYNHQNKFEHAGAAGGFLDREYYPFCQGRIFHSIEEDKGQYDKSREVFWATGACLFIRKDAYHNAGGLDEDFFAHMEEIDLCWRLKTRGYAIYYCADAKVYHVGGGTLNYASPRKTFLNFRNSLFMILKNYDGPVFIKLLWRMFLDGSAMHLFLFKLEFRNLGAIFKAHFSFYRYLPKMIRKRRQLKKERTTFNRTGLYKGIIIIKKFLGGVKSFQQLDPRKFH
ncbi:glycosyltransferase family 2 protein [Crocinitomix catalasitica]|nr:glycosyltransferase family 2 protein [Crocinitomix catalasitica]